MEIIIKINNWEELKNILEGREGFVYNYFGSSNGDIGTRCKAFGSS